jgi:predicted Zn-dependent protease
MTGTTLMRRARWIPAVALFAGGAACATNPVTGRTQLALISEAQEIQMGQQAAQSVQASIGLVDDAALQSYVQDVGQRMAAASERPQLPWTFRVVDDPTPNAFALPGGFVFLTRGMMAHFESEAEMASVVGHEIGHITPRHSVTMISRAQLAQIGLGVGGVLFPALEQFGGLASGGLSLLFLRYSRDAERQADELGFRYGLEQGYDMRTMSHVFTTLARLGEAQQQSALPSWLSSHPHPAERIQEVEARIAATELPANLVRRRAEYLRRIDGLVYGVNPRNGFFQAGLFLHPDLQFQMQFPNGWATQNLAQSVSAVGPQRDAAIALSLAEASSAIEGAQRFFSQQGVAAGRSSRQSINGNPAVSTYFQAQTQEGVLAGIVTFVEHRQRVYQILTYSVGQRFQQYENLFLQVTGSFQTLTDPQALAAQPNRIRIVTLDRAMTMAQFHQAYPSAIPIQELLILNQIDDANRSIPAGQLLKRVTQ